MKIILLTLLLHAGTVFAAPTVIRDYGGYDSGVPDTVTITKNAQLGPVKSPRMQPKISYPLTSSMRPGVLANPVKFPSKRLNRFPYFIMGGDELSREWFAENKDYLIKINAKGLATNIQSEKEFRTLEALVAPLKLNAIPLDELAAALNLSVYPLLITNEEIAQ